MELFIVIIIGGIINCNKDNWSHLLATGNTVCKFEINLLVVYTTCNYNTELFIDNSVSNSIIIIMIKNKSSNNNSNDNSYNNDNNLIII